MKAVTTYVADDGSRHESADTARARDWMYAQQVYVRDVAAAIRPIFGGSPLERERIAALYLSTPALFDRLAAAAATIARPVKPGDAP
ncbi:MAG: hypothetical protein AB7O45_16040 [Alphaproteobacteria bacterium]